MVRAESGIAIAVRLAREGARVSIVSRYGCTLRQAQGDRTFFRAAADLTERDEVRRAFAACRAENGAIAILVNNSGIAESAPLARTSDAMWDRIIATNLTGTFLCTREGVEEMRAAGWGRIVNIASTAGLDGAAYISAYCASKHGVVGFTRAIAAELSGTGVTANAICPGYTETEMMARAVANVASKTGRSEDGGARVDGAKEIRKAESRRSTRSRRRCSTHPRHANRRSRGDSGFRRSVSVPGVTRRTSASSARSL